MPELYKAIICDVSIDDKQTFDDERKKLVADISDQNNILTKIRALLLSDDIDIADYKIMKSKCEEKIVRLEADLKAKTAVKTDLNAIVDEALIRLVRLIELYSNGGIDVKRYIIGLIYPEKWTIIENKGRTSKVNLAALLIYQINSTLWHKKAGVKTKIRTNSGSVPHEVLYTNRFLEDLKHIANLNVFLSAEPITRDFKLKYKRCYTDKESSRNSLSKLYVEDCLQLSKLNRRGD